MPYELDPEDPTTPEPSATDDGEPAPAESPTGDADATNAAPGVLGGVAKWIGSKVRSVVKRSPKDMNGEADAADEDHGDDDVAPATPKSRPKAAAKAKAMKAKAGAKAKAKPTAKRAAKPAAKAAKAKGKSKSKPKTAAKSKKPAARAKPKRRR